MTMQRPRVSAGTCVNCGKKIGARWDRWWPESDYPRPVVGAKVYGATVIAVMPERRTPIGISVDYATDKLTGYARDGYFCKRSCGEEYGVKAAARAGHKPQRQALALLNSGRRNGGSRAAK